MERLSIIPTSDVVVKHPRFMAWLENNNISWDAFIDHALAIPLSQLNREGLDSDSWERTKPGRPISIPASYSIEIVDEVVMGLLNKAGLLDDLNDDLETLGEAFADKHPDAYDVCYPVIHELLEYVGSYLHDVMNQPVADTPLEYYPGMVSVRRGVGYDLVLAVDYYPQY